MPNIVGVFSPSGDTEILDTTSRPTKFRLWTSSVVTILPLQMDYGLYNKRMDFLDYVLVSSTSAPDYLRATAAPVELIALYSPADKIYEFSVFSSPRAARGLIPFLIAQVSLTCISF